MNQETSNVKSAAAVACSAWLACPFCGRQPEIISRGYYYGGKWVDWVSITCNASAGGCGCSQSATTEAEASAKWNARALPEIGALMEIVEGVRGERWAANGRRLVDTPEWCALYVAWRRQANADVSDRRDNQKR